MIEQEYNEHYVVESEASNKHARYHIRQQGGDGALRRFQNATVGVVATRPQNAAYRAVTFTGMAISRKQECTSMIK
ncbi:hypothetical protein Taro_015169 [Colocasia esculenta]|uniref:Uncharacterized protein n=1 Tax=Colocasia esculenta TaxID=4460 RepID=A0A843UAU7_COLES|nr:hypothetical protein [Colocasia esculenta]